MANNESGEGHPPLSAQVADKLLDLLSKDDGFRELFAKDPIAALAKAGHPPAQALVDGGAYSPAAFTCMVTRAIAPKDEIEAARLEIRSVLTSASSHTNPHYFEAGRIGEATSGFGDGGTPSSDS